MLGIQPFLAKNRACTKILYNQKCRQKSVDNNTLDKNTCSHARLCLTTFHHMKLFMYIVCRYLVFGNIWEGKVIFGFFGRLPS